jgi:hypothetical protein
MTAVIEDSRECGDMVAEAVSRVASICALSGQLWSCVKEQQGLLAGIAKGPALPPHWNSTVVRVIDDDADTLGDVVCRLIEGHKSDFFFNIQKKNESYIYWRSTF